MKCPNCQVNQKYKYGMTCNSCGYQFALDPKTRYGISDMAFKLALDRLSGEGNYYFTYDQLYAQIYRLTRKKHHLGLLPLSCLGIFFLIFGTVILMGFLEMEVWAPVVLFILIAFSVFRLSRRPFKLPSEIPAQFIEKYRAKHPIDKLVNGKQFEQMANSRFDEEFLSYAPERILIAERNDMADMLIMNRFHFENKALVVSARKYPKPAFRACQEFLLRHPDIPVLLLHDCSESGVQMQGRLVTDKEWNLKGKQINNLGLHPKDVDNLKRPMWIPHKRKKKITEEGEATENIRNGYRMPLGVATPKATLSTMSLAVVAGAALLSEELLAQQRASDSGQASMGSGFG